MTAESRPSKNNIASDEFSNAHRRNTLLRALSAEAFEFLKPYCELKSLSAGQVLYEEAVPFTHAIFPHEGVISFVTTMADGRTAEKTTFGLEGFIGFVLFLDGGLTLSRSVVQIPGTATFIPVERLNEAAEKYPEIRSLVLMYSKALLVQALETVACNSLHRAEERCCRWLLSAHDRIEGNRFYLKQETLAEVLGLRRATVGEICASLQRDNILCYSRGWITVLDRASLQARSCECYRKVRSVFERVLPGTYSRS